MELGKQVGNLNKMKQNVLDPKVGKGIINGFECFTVAVAKVMMEERWEEEEKS